MKHALALALLAASVAAQGIVSGVVTPNPALPGQTVNLVVTNGASFPIMFNSGCAYVAVRSGSPTGTVVDAPICLTIIVTVQPCGTRSQPWTQPPNLLPGLYYFGLLSRICG